MINPEEKLADDLKNPAVKFVDENLGAIFGKNWQQEIIFLAVDGVIPNITKQKSKIFKIDKKDKSKDYKIFIKKILSNHKQLFGYDSEITYIWSYKTPLSEKQYTSLIFYHEYVIIKIKSKEKNYYASLQKTSQRLWMLVSDQFQFVKDHKPIHQENDKKSKSIKIVSRYQSDYWKPILLKSSQVKCDYLALVQFLYQKNHQQDKYDVLESNCKYFADKVRRFVQNYLKLQTKFNIPLFEADDAKKIDRIKEIGQQIKILQTQKVQLVSELTKNSKQL